MDLIRAFLAAVVWNTPYENSPAGGNSPSFGDDQFRDLKSAVRERFEKEHTMNLASGTVAGDGQHKSGSAKVYYQASEPTVRPDGVTALTADDNGRRWVRTSDKREYVYVHPDWEIVTALVGADNTFTGDNNFSGSTTISSLATDNAPSDIPLDKGFLFPANIAADRFTVSGGMYSAAIDRVNDKIIYTYGPSYNLLRCDLDGSNTVLVASIGVPFKLAVNHTTGDYLVLETSSTDLRIYSSGGALQSTISNFSSVSAEIGASAICYNDVTGRLLVGSNTNAKIFLFTGVSKTLYDTLTVSMATDEPEGIDIDELGNILFYTEDDEALFYYEEDPLVGLAKQPMPTVGALSLNTAGLGRDSSNNFYIFERGGSDRVIKFMNRILIKG